MRIISHSCEDFHFWVNYLVLYPWCSQAKTQQQIYVKLFPLEDNGQQFRIQGNARYATWSNFFYFHEVFGAKMDQIIASHSDPYSWRPPAPPRGNPGAATDLVTLTRKARMISPFYHHSHLFRIRVEKGQGYLSVWLFLVTIILVMNWPLEQFRYLFNPAAVSTVFKWDEEISQRAIQSTLFLRYDVWVHILNIWVASHR